MDIKIERDKEGIWLIIDNQQWELTEDDFQQLADAVTNFMTDEVTALADLSN